MADIYRNRNFSNDRRKFRGATTLPADVYWGDFRRNPLPNLTNVSYSLSENIFLSAARFLTKFPNYSLVAFVEIVRSFGYAENYQEPEYYKLRHSARNLRHS